MKKTIIIISAILLVLAVGVVGLLVFRNAGGRAEDKWQEQYDLGARYISEGNYQEAIIAFTAAIDIDPKRPEAYLGRGGAYVASGETAENLAAAIADYSFAISADGSKPEAYLGLADAYIRSGDFDRAREVLEQGRDATGSQEIADKLAQIEEGNITDSSGKLWMTSVYDEEHKLLYRQVYSYDEKGNQISLTVFNGVGEQIDYWDGFEYDDEGRYLAGYGVEPETGIITGYFMCERNEAGQIVRESSYTLNGELKGTMEYEYDERASEKDRIERWSCCRQYDTNGDLVIEYKYEYDEAGNLISESFYFPDGTYMGKSTREYNDNGDQVYEAQYDAAGNLISEWYFDYDR